MKLLIVEDSAPLRKSLTEYLREEGFAVDSAANGEDGLFNALQWEYDALVLDVMVPAPDGFEILRQLRAKGNTTPVLFLTARSALDDRLRGLDSGADDYLVKPFEMAEMVARIRAAIRRSRGAPDPLLQVGALSINTASRIVLLEGRTVDLTDREYALLELLATNCGKFVSRDKIQECLFDENEDSMSNMIDVYIYRLRQKFGKSRILSRRKMGYQLVA